MSCNKQRIAWLILGVCGLILPLAGCSSGGGESASTTTNSSGEVLSSLSTGYSVPSNISAVPESTATTAAANLKLVTRAVANLSATTDYQKAIPAKYVEEPVLDQFAIIEQVLNAINQTHYADNANINHGPYKAMVAWADKKDGREVKTLEPWVVDSRMIVIDGQDVNRVLCWIEEPNPNAPGGIQTVKAEFKVYSPATFDTAGNVVSYGKWELNVKFNADASNFFVAKAEAGSDGYTIIKINEYENFGPSDVHSMKGVLYRTNTSGYGTMEYTDWDSCDQWPCTPTISKAQYAYNSGYLAVKKTKDIAAVNGSPVVGPVAYKDRSAKVEMTHRYGLFYNENPVSSGVAAGDDVTKHKRFGFPIAYTDDNGIPAHAYYGAWQGRHQIWAGESGGSLAAGTTVTKEAWGSAAPVSYTVAPIINGSFTRRGYVTASLTDIKDVPVETWIDKRYDLIYSGSASAWQYCSDGWLDWSSGPSPTCKDFANNPQAMSDFTNYAALVVGAKDRKWVNIGRWDNSNQQNQEYVYLAAADGRATWTVAGFYPAERGQDGKMQSKSGESVYIPTTGDQLGIGIGGSIYIAYTGDFSGNPTTTGWVQKEVLDFNTRNWQPVFGNTDTPFSPEMGREYYMNSNGVNYVVKRKGATEAADSYDVLLEIQKTANPVNCTTTNCTTIIPATADYFRTPWEPGKRYDFNKDSAAANHLMLKYLTDDPNTATVDESAVETVVSQGMWGLQAWSTNGTSVDSSDDYPVDANGAQVVVDQWGMPTGAIRPVDFNWEYCNPSAGSCWGAQTYLKDSSNNYAILDNPIALESISVTNRLGDAKSLLLQYDGWMHGLPDLYEVLRQNNWTFTTEIKGKIINIPAGTAATDGTNGYYIKPLETSVFLETVTATDISNAGGTVPALTLADGINLATAAPTYTEHNMGAIPTVTTIKYSEGVLVE